MPAIYIPRGRSYIEQLRIYEHHTARHPDASGDRSLPYPISWEEQRTLFKALPDHLARVALLKVNTGCREQEVCQLQWVENGAF